MNDENRTYRDKPEAPQPLPLAVVDNHTHLDISRDGAPTPDVRRTIDEALAVGVDRMVQVGCDLDGARFTERVIDEHPELLGAVALHPNEVPKLAEAGELDAAYVEIERIAQHSRVRAVGETGLDYFRTGPDGIAVQQSGFRWHIALAKKLGKALQIHDRDAHDDVMRILAEDGAPDVTVLHCFSGDVEMARECVERGYYVSVAGVVTFKNARDLRDALAQVPLENLLVETDAPYLTPSPHRGATNAPALVPLTVRALAEVKNVDVSTLCAALSENSERVYGPW
ncbi:TatD family hydrolase [Dermacoccus abyssi]|uniref:TatD family hydrolase n=1 Tax=Dermacoccus abyssi TaxID=322596 RepID=UPI002AD2863F|nr:TatD family hydrolase [Dermacoccus abyssi]